MEHARATHRAVEWAAREAYGRILATLAGYTNDISEAEEAISSALEKALSVWPETGVPEKPDAWLITTAKRMHIDRIRRDKTVATHKNNVLQTYLERAAARDDVTGWPLPDPRLKLLFICAHPAIDKDIHAPLMLQTIFGLSAKDIAPLFLMSADQLSQQLVRAKRKIKIAHIQFEMPDEMSADDRLPPVLDAIYAAFCSGVTSRSPDLMREALFLAEMCAALIPKAPECKGLFALCLFSAARFEASRDEQGRYVPLSEQLVSSWDTENIAYAEELLRRAKKQDRIGRYQIEAVIQSAHIHAARTGDDVSRIVISFYELLLEAAPSMGAHIGFAAAILAHKDPETALAYLDDLDERKTDYQPYWATRADTLARLKKKKDAVVAYQQAIERTHEEAIRTYLLSKLSRLQSDD